MIHHTPSTDRLDRLWAWTMMLEFIEAKTSDKLRRRSRHWICAMLCTVSVVTLSDRVSAQVANDPEARLAELGLTLPAPYEPFANYVRAVRTGNLVFLGGHSECAEPFTKGKVGADRTVTEGYAAARLTGLCLLASLKAEIGDLNKVVRIVRVFGMVNATESFTEHSRVVNGCSDLLVEVFGERGRHARAAVGMASLPLNLTVEIEMVVEVTDESP